MLYYAGDATLETSVLNLKKEQCYWAEAEVTSHFNITDVYEAADNFHFVAFARAYGGDVVKLGEHPFAENVGLPTMTVNGSYTFGFPFYSLDEDPRITVMMGPSSTFTSGGFGSYVRIDSIGVYEVSEGHCIGAPTV